MNLKKLFLTTIYILILYCFSVSAFLIYYSNKNYNEKENIYLLNNVLTINKSYLTNYSYNNKLLIDDKIFVIIDIDTSIKRDNLFLKVNGKLYSHINNNDYQEYFKDLDNDPLIFVIPKKYVNKKMLILYKYNHNDLERNIYVKLEPIRLNYNYKETIINLNDIVSIKNVINNFKIESYDIKDKFNYKYLEGNKEITSIIKSNNKTIIKLQINKNKLPDNFDNFVSIKYRYNDKVYVANLKNKTPNNINNCIYYEVDSRIIESNEIWLDIKNRNEIYKFILK